MPGSPDHKIYAISDNALTIDFGNRISEEVNLFVLSFLRNLQEFPLPGIKEALPAYSSLTIYYDLFALKKMAPNGTTVYDRLCRQLEQRLITVDSEADLFPRTIKIPVCYETGFAPDTPTVINDRSLSQDELIQLHTSVTYRVYMLGFLPGFPYMGELDEKLIMPRKTQPQQIAAGSVGIAGKQTGIYPFASPGGWQIIGRTPLRIFDHEQEEPALLKAGDIVQFYSISSYEFEHY